MYLYYFQSYWQKSQNWWITPPVLSARSKFWGMSGSADRGEGDNSIQFIDFGRVGDKSFKEWRQKMGGGGWKDG